MNSHYDFVVLGSGVAGLSFAIKAAAHGRVAIVTKRGKAETNTAWAQGGIACVWAQDDTVESHVADTLEAGAGLCDPLAVRTIVSEGPARVRELISWGLHFDEQDAAGGGKFNGCAQTRNPCANHQKINFHEFNWILAVWA